MRLKYIFKPKMVSPLNVYAIKDFGIVFLFKKIIKQTSLFSSYNFEFKNAQNCWTRIGTRVFIKGPPSTGMFCDRLFLFWKARIVQRCNLIGWFSRKAFRLKVGLYDLQGFASS